MTNADATPSELKGQIGLLREEMIRWQGNASRYAEELRNRQARIVSALAEIDAYGVPTDPAELPEDEHGDNVLDRVRAKLQGSINPDLSENGSDQFGTEWRLELEDGYTEQLDEVRARGYMANEFKVARRIVGPWREVRSAGVETADRPRITSSPCTGNCDCTCRPEERWAEATEPTEKANRG